MPCFLKRGNVGALFVTSEKHHEIMVIPIILMGMAAMVMVITVYSVNGSENVSFWK